MADEGDQMHMEQSVKRRQMDFDCAGDPGGGRFRICALHRRILAIEKLTQDLSAQPGSGEGTAESHADAEEPKRRSARAGRHDQAGTRPAHRRVAGCSRKPPRARLEKEQKAQISQVTGEIAGVKTDVGGVKTDVASTKADLEATKAKLQSTIGDLGVQSGLIAHTAGDLEILKHKGDRNYYEFTLLKGAKPQPVSTVSLQLKKADAKKGKFTMNVTSDDKTIEKKDRNICRAHSVLLRTRSPVV